MAAPLRFDIDLTIRMSPDASQPTVHDFARVTAAGSEITVQVDDPAVFAGGRRDVLPTLRAFADALAEYGIVVSVVGPKGILAKMGDVKASIGDRLLTGSRNIHLGSAQIVAAASRRTATTDATSDALRIPPLTLLPIAPTLLRNRHDRITTTHYIAGSGRPRLIFTIGSATWNGQMPREFDLKPTTTTIGSSSSADLQLAGLESIHAEIRHSDDDEYRLVIFGPEGREVPVLQADTPDPGTGQILRTGARIALGEWRLAFFREEFADHGRPFGGRLGGELSVQRGQPPRPQATRSQPPAQ